jgi:hypothetical protein
MTTLAKNDMVLRFEESTNEIVLLVPRSSKPGELNEMWRLSPTDIDSRSPEEEIGISVLSFVAAAFREANAFGLERYREHFGKPDEYFDKE